MFAFVRYNSTSGTLCCDGACFFGSDTVHKAFCCCAVLCCVVLCCAVLCCAVLCGAGGELLAAGLPDSHVYKAFNTVGTTVMAAVEDMGYPVQM
jgi:hypothetical protein